MRKMLATLFLTLTVVALGSAEERESVAEAAALEWLSHLDAEDYETSWRRAGSLFRAQVTSVAWADAARLARQPLGAFDSRELAAARYASSLPGAPDGEYFVLQFATAFANKAAGVETVTLALEEGEWRVVGYFVR